MYRMMVVEDDSTIRRGLVKIIGEMGLPLARIQEAENGQSALALFESFEPQIIVTDIRMPLVDGLELIRLIQQTRPSTSFVILSGYNDFEYARKAIQYGVKEYLMKPVERLELETVLAKIIQELNFHKEEMQLRNSERKLQKEQIGRYRANLLWDIMLGQNNKTELERKCKVLHAALPNGRLLIVASYGKGFQSNNLTTILEATFPDSQLLLCGTTSYRYHFALVALSPDSSAAADVPAALRSAFALDKKLFKECTVAMAETERLSDVPNMCDACRTLLDLRLVSNVKDKILTQNDLRVSGHMEDLHMLLHFIRQAMTIGDFVAIERTIRDFFTPLPLSQNCNPKTLIRCAKLLELSICAYSPEQYRYYEEHLDQLQTIEFLFSASTLYVDFVDAITARITAFVKNTSPYQAVSPVKQVIQYVEQHYAKDIGLVYVANLVNMNTSYFSSLFKKKTGLSFVTYLHQVRIERAKELLQDPINKVYEIAKQVGFQNEKYFMKVFKTVVGKTPSEYKQNLDQ